MVANNFLFFSDQVEFSANRPVRKTLIKTEKMVSDIVCFAEGQTAPTHKHPKQDEIFFVIQGSGTFRVDNEEKSVGQGDVIYAPAGVEHGISTNSTEQLIIYYVKTSID